MSKTKKKKTEAEPRVWDSQMRGFLHAEMFTQEEQDACLQFVELLRNELPDYVAATYAIQRYFRMSLFFADAETSKQDEEMLDAFVKFANDIFEGCHYQTLDE